MPAYRFYDLPRSGGDRPDELKFFDDAAAMAWALRRAVAEGVEIWEAGRFVGRIHPKAPTDSDPRDFEDSPAG